jgi:hypothetical protein
VQWLDIARCPSGEIGRHSGLKIRRLPEKGRTGSIPVSGTISVIQQVSYRLKTRMAPGFAGFLLSCHVSRSSMRYQQIDGIFVGTFSPVGTFF